MPGVCKGPGHAPTSDATEGPPRRSLPRSDSDMELIEAADDVEQVGEANDDAEPVGEIHDGERCGAP